MSFPSPSLHRARIVVPAFILAGVAALASPHAAAYARMCTTADTLLFGNQAVGTSTTRRSVISNCGDEPWRFTGVSVHPSTGAAFQVDAACVTGQTLVPGGACNVDVTFAPSDPGQTSGGVWLHNSTSTPDQLVTFYGRGIDAQAGGATADFAPAVIAFGAQPLAATAGPRVLALRNLGTVPLVPSALVLNGPGAYDYTALATGDPQDCAVGTPIPPGGECHLNVYFTPSEAGTRGANVVVDAPQLATLAIATLTGAGVVAPVVPTAPVVEFHDSASGQYFLSADAAEIAYIDTGRLGAGWSRTGMQFKAWARDGDAPADAQPVCRFFGTPGVGPNSHFYTADATECAKVRGDLHWIDEGTAFRARLPAAGQCPAAHVAILRLWRAGGDPTASRHRYVSDAALVPGMEADGFVLEGPVLCAPQ